MNLPLPVAVAIMLSFGALLLVIMWRGWRSLQARSAAKVSTLATVPAEADLGAARSEPIEGTYVTTTTAGDWLDRVAARDLGYKAKAVVQVFDAGVLVARAGASDLFVPVADLTGASRTSGIAGKYVGGEGIVVIAWSAVSPSGERTALETGVRTLHKTDRPLLLDAVSALAASSSPSPDSRTDIKESE